MKSSIRKIFIFFCIIILCNNSCVVPTYISKSHLEEKMSLKSDETISSLLISGAGSTPSRVFLDNMSTELISQLSKKDIRADYIYLGKIPKYSTVDMDTLIKKKYNAYLLFYPTDTSFVNNNKDQAEVWVPLPGGYSKSAVLAGNQYKENFWVQLYLENGSVQKVWKGILYLDFDFGHSSKYPGIAKKILDQLKKSGFIRK